MTTLQVIIAAVVTLFLFACVTGNKEANNSVYKIGAIVFLTGPQAELGTEAKNALDIAVDDINRSGGVQGKSIKLLYEDSKDNPKDAIMAFNKLMMDDVPIILSTGDVVSLNLAPLAKQNHKPLVCTVAIGPGITKNNDWVFRVCTQAEKDADLMARYAAQHLKLKSAGVIYINNECGAAMCRKFKDTFETFGGKVTDSETFTIMDKDVRNQLVKLMQTHPEAIWVTGWGPAFCAAIRQLKELRYNGKVLSVATMAVPYVLEQTTPANEGVYFTDTQFDAHSDAPHVMNFVKEYKTRYRSSPSVCAAFCYDSLKLIQTAANSAASSGTKLKDALHHIKAQEGLVGKMSFAANREIEYPLVVKRIEHGKPCLVSSN